MEQNERGITSQIVIDHTQMVVDKYAVAKNICVGFVAVVIDDIWCGSGLSVLLGQVGLAQRHPYWGWHKWGFATAAAPVAVHLVSLPEAALHFLVMCS